MEKLTLEVLAPYLPYGLKVEFNRRIHPKGKEINELTCTNIDFINWPKNYIIKPILRPLYDLIDTTIARELNNISGFYFVYDLIHKTISIQTDNDIELTDMITGLNMLYANHFDVFGLIEKGLAIDINTIENDTTGSN